MTALPAPPPSPPPGPVSCNPVRLVTCGMPYPSDAFAVVDASSPTGVHLEVGDAILPPDVLAQLPRSVWPSAIYNAKTGFSAAGPVLFEVDRAADPATLPDDGGETVVVFDATTGERVPVLAALDDDAANRTPRGYVVRAWPRTRFAFGHRYVAALTNGLRSVDGGRYAPSPGFAAAISGDPARSPMAGTYAGVAAFLGARGIPASALVSAVSFTVRSEEEVTAPLLAMAAEAYRQDHPVRHLQIGPGVFPGIAATVTGQVRATDFRGPEGNVAYRPGDTGTPEWLDFVMAVPESAAREPAPVALYGHGITAFKETYLAVAPFLAQDGVATIAVDQPNHGSRGAAEGGLLTDIMAPAHTPRMVGLVPQSSIDFVSLLKAVESSLAGLDVAPLNLLDPFRGDGVPDLDTSRIFYAGTSMGGVLGAAFTAVAPHLDGAFLHVAGVGITHILTGSSVWKGLHFDHVAPENASGGVAAVAVAGIQQMVDVGDAVNFVHLWRQPPPTLTARPVLLLYGRTDAVVPNFASEALARMGGLAPIDHDERRLPADGYGSYLVDSPLQGDLAHMSFLLPDAMDVQTAWVRRLLGEGFADLGPQ